MCVSNPPKIIILWDHIQKFSGNGQSKSATPTAKAKRTGTSTTSSGLQIKPGVALVPLLKLLNSKSSDMEASAVISRDGICLASALNQGVDPDRMGAMCATLLGLADTTVKEFERGTLQQVLLYGSDGILLLVQIGKHHVLAVSAEASINVGMILLDARKVVQQMLPMVPNNRNTRQRH